MLVLTIKENDIIKIGDAFVFVKKIKGKQTLIGINADENIKIERYDQHGNRKGKKEKSLESGGS